MNSSRGGGTKSGQTSPSRLLRLYVNAENPNAAAPALANLDPPAPALALVRITQMKAPRLTERIGAGDPAGLHSTVFRIWTHKSDVYAAVREHGHNMKVSLHSDGNCFAGLTREFAEKEHVAVAAAGGRRHQSRWVRLTHVGSRMVTPLQIVIPESELRTGRQKSESAGEEPTWIPATQYRDISNHLTRIHWPALAG